MSWMKSLSSVYGQAVQFKNRLFDQERFKIHRVSVPVISIGNLTVGGTGKTPFVDYCVKELLAKKLKVGVVSRAYKAQAKKPVRVQAQAPQAALKFGDEPVWIAQQNPAAHVFAGQKKWEIAEWAVHQEKLDVILVDDGFQHRALHRDLDIVVLDATEKWERYEVLPVGRAREKFENVRRAQLIALSKTNWADKTDLQFLRQQLPAGIPVIEMTSQIRSFQKFSGDQTCGAHELGATAFLFCSIARPDLFESQMAGLFKEIELLSFPDHHQYTSADVQKILSAAKAQPATALVCTEKDAVKLKSIWPPSEPLWISRLETEISAGKEKLDAAFAGLFA